MKIPDFDKKIKLNKAQKEWIYLALCSHALECKFVVLLDTYQDPTLFEVEMAMDNIRNQDKSTCWCSMFVEITKLIKEVDEVYYRKTQKEIK